MNALGAAAILKILVYADLQADQASGIAGHAEGLQWGVVRFGKTLLDVGHADLLFMVQASILRRHLHVRERLLRLAKVILRRKPGTGAVLLPLMLDQAAAGHKVQHMVHGIGRYWASVRARHRRLSTAGLGPEAVKNKSLVSANSALAGMVTGMTRAVVRRPGK